MSTLSNIIGLLIIAAYVIYFIVYYVTIIYKAGQKAKSNQQAKNKEEAEMKYWLDNDEIKHRNVYTYPEDWGMRRKFVAKRANYTCKICGRKGWLGFHVH